MLQILNKSRNIRILLLLTIFLQIIFFIRFMNLKDSLFLDEIYTYSTANSSFGTVFYCTDLKFKQDVKYYYYKWLDGNFFKNYLAASKNHCFNYSDINEMHLFDSHPPLYCYLLHTICSFFPESFSKWHGFSLNLIVFVGVQILLFIISRKIFCSEKYALLTCLVYGFSPGSIDCFIYIRMYSLSTLFFLLLLYLYLKFLDNKYTLLRFSSLVLTMILGGLTHYHFFIYAFLLTFSFCVIAIMRKTLKNNCWVPLAFVMGVIIAFLLFPAILFQIENTPRASEAFSLGNNAYTAINCFSYLILEFLNCSSKVSVSLSIIFILFVLVVFLIQLINKYLNNYDKDVLFLLVIPTFLFFVFISISVNFFVFGKNGQRFFLVIYPLVITTIIVFLNKNKKLLFGLFIVSLLSAFYVVDFCYKDSCKYNTELEKVFNDNNIILYCDYIEILQVLSPKLLNCSKVFLIPRTKNPFIPSDYSKNNKTYLVFINHNSVIDLPFKKVKENYYYDLKYSVYDINQKTD